MSKYTTGEMANLCNISVRTVQFYDTKGILPPTDLTEGGRRLYTDDDLTKLRLICTLKTIGLSLELIKGILESEAPTKVLELLLDEHAKSLGNEISERQKQLETVEVIKKSIRNNAAIPVNSIIDIERTMKQNKKVRTKFRKLVALACVITLPTAAAITLWVMRGMWVPFAVVFPLSQAAALLLDRHFYKDTAFICPECNGVFTPPYSKVMFTSGTTKARWLACTKCGYKGYCVETVVG